MTIPSTPGAALAMRGRAVALACVGLRVFKLIPDGKTPAIPEFYDVASSDPDVVAAMWTEPVSGESLHNNIGILTGDGLLVIDVDVKDGKQGAESLAALEDMGLDSATLRSITGSGGHHLFYGLPPDVTVRNSASKLGAGLDVRGHHGFVVAPGSTISGRAYSWAEPHREMKKAPAWLIDMCGRASAPSSPAAQIPLIELDLPENIERARQWLIHEAPEAIEGVGGNATTYRIAARAKDFGLSATTALELLIAHWNETKAHPMWDYEDLAGLVENVYRYGTKPPGITPSAHVEFEPVDVGANRKTPERPAGAGRKHFRRLFEDGCARARQAIAAPAHQLVKNLLGGGKMSVVYGASNSGKTFLALDIAYHIAAGRPWSRRKTAQAPAVYVAAEAGEDINLRLEAIRLYYKPAVAPPLDVVPCQVDLFSPQGDLGELIALVKEAAAEHGAPVGLVVIDTLARVMAGGNENETRDMGVFVRNIDRIRSETDAHVMIVHHTGKDKSKGARGSSALQAATDTEMEIADKKIEIKKQRSLVVGEPIKFDLRPIDIGRDEDGEAVTSCVVVLRTAGEFEALQLAGQSLKMSEAAAAAAKERAGPGGDIFTAVFSTAEWTTAYREQVAKDQGLAGGAALSKNARDGLSERNLRRLQKEVLTGGHVKKTRAGCWMLRRP